MKRHPYKVYLSDDEYNAVMAYAKHENRTFSNLTVHALRCLMRRSKKAGIVFPEDSED